MSSIDKNVLRAFLEEIEKMSSWNGLGVMGAGVGSGAALGSLAGGLHGAYKDYRTAKDQGFSTGEAIASGVGGGVSGALRGAQVGGVLGGVTGGAAALLSPAKAEAVRRAVTTSRVPLVGSGSRFMQRQVHGLTGWTPEGLGPRDALAQIGMGSSLREGHVRAAQQQLEKARAAGAGAKRTISDRVLGRSGIEGSEARLRSARESLSAADEAERRGITSLPGMVSGLRRDPLGTLRASAKNELSGSPAAFALQVGLPGLAVARELSKKEDPEDPGKYRRAASKGLQAAGNVLLSPLPMGTQQLVTNSIGSLHRRLTQPSSQGTVMPPKAPDLTTDNGQAVAGERIVSERAAGSLGEGSPS